MALFLPILGQLSGKLAGNVFAHNKAGQYARQYVVPVNPSSFWQSFYRGVFAQGATRWKSVLTSVQRDAWNLYAANTPVTNRLGQTIYLDGLNMYQATNVNARAAGIPYLDDGPTTFGLASHTPITASIAVGTQTPSINFTEADEWVEEDGAVMFLNQGQPAGAGVNFFGGPYRPLTFIYGDSTTPPTTPDTAGALKWPVAADNRVYGRARIMRADGRLSPVQRFEFTLT